MVKKFDGQYSRRTCGKQESVITPAGKTTLTKRQDGNASPKKEAGIAPTPRNDSRMDCMDTLHADPVFLLTEASSSGSLPDSRQARRE